MGYEDLLPTIVMGGITYTPTSIGYKSNITLNCKNRVGSYTRYAIKIVPGHKIVLVWDLARRLRFCGTADLRLSKDSLAKEDLHERTLRCIYQHFNSKRDRRGRRIEEKVMVVGFDVLYEFLANPDAHLALNPDDLEFEDLSSEAQESIQAELKRTCEESGIFPRKRYSTRHFAREAAFRNRVLEHYQFKCAICRLGEVKALDAAHKRGREVRVGSYFDTSDGVCLCANHHRMYDSELFDIDFTSGRLIEVDERVAGQEWYKRFYIMYSGRILL